MYRYALAMAGDAAAAADATHDAFVALASRPTGFDPSRGALGAYLAGIARHALLAFKRGAFEVLDDDHAEGDTARRDCLAGRLQVRRQGRDALWRALRELPWPLREAIVLVDLQERPYAEAAAIAGFELNTLRTRLHRARQRLAHCLARRPRRVHHERRDPRPGTCRCRRCCAMRRTTCATCSRRAALRERLAATGRPAPRRGGAGGARRWPGRAPPRARWPCSCRCC